MNSNTIITIGRQFGSGGHEIGDKLAKSYGIPCYDKELLARAAKESGFCEEMIKNHDERPTNSFLFNLVMDTYSMGYSTGSYVDMPIGQRVFLAQFDAIKEVAKEGACVIVGRCADYALSEHAECINIFIYADMDNRIKRIVEKYNVSEKEAKDMINKKDKQRASYYNYYSNKKWGQASSYNLCIDSGILGIDGTVEMLKNFIDAAGRK